MRPISAGLLCSALLLTACGSDSKGALTTGFPDAIAIKAVAAYATNVNANYVEAVAAAKRMQQTIDAFVATPTAQTLEAARKAWIAARVPYGTSEAFRFYDGPIDNPETGPEGEINGWPLDELHVDYTRDQQGSGLVNDLTKEVTAEVIAAENEKQGEKAITTGWHAIEFLLWGQDDAKPGTGAGKRPFTDYVDGAAGTAKNQARRRMYLKNVTALLVEDLDSVRAAWEPGKDNYGAKFGVTASDAAREPDAKKEAIGKLLRAIGSMAKAELSGERMTVAYKNRSEEDEHSCFSDSTATDLLGNGTGIENVWLGRYGTADGVGLDEVVAAADATLAAKTTADLAESVAKLRKLKDLQDAGTPIDMIIAAPDESPGRKAMLEAIQGLKLVAADVERAAAVLKLSITLEKPTQEI